MIAIFNAPIVANIPEALIWVVLLVGWVVIQAFVKNSRKAEEELSDPDDDSPEGELNHFLDELTGRARKTAASDPSLERPLKDRGDESQKQVHLHKKQQPIAHSQKQQIKKKTAGTKPPPIRAIRATTRPQKQRISSPAKTIKREEQKACQSDSAMPLRSFKQQKSWRSAIIYREIIGPPKALRSLDMSAMGRGE